MLICWLAQPAFAGSLAESPRTMPPAQTHPQPPPPSQLPGPLDEAQRLEFDRLRTEGILNYRVGRYRAAESYFRQALAIRPDDATTRAWLEACGRAQRRPSGERR